LKRVADLARSFADEFGAGEWAYLAGLWHAASAGRPFTPRQIGQIPFHQEKTNRRLEKDKHFVAVL